MLPAFEGLWQGVTPDFEDALRGHESFLGAVEALRGEGRTLRPFTSEVVAKEDSPLAENDFMDPDHVPRSWTRSLQRFVEGLAKRTAADE